VARAIIDCSAVAKLSASSNRVQGSAVFDLMHLGLANDAAWIFAAAAQSDRKRWRNLRLISHRASAAL